MKTNYTPWVAPILILAVLAALSLPAFAQGNPPPPNNPPPNKRPKPPIPPKPPKGSKLIDVSWQASGL